MNNCKRCDKEFEQKPNKIFCSPYCRRKFHRADNQTRAKERREWRNKNIERNRENERKDYQRNRTKRLARMKRIRDTPEFKRKFKANQLANYHLKDLPKICSQCKITKNVYMHHEDYFKPLEVIMLCASCHNQHHHLKEVTQ